MSHLGLYSSAFLCVVIGVLIYDKQQSLPQVIEIKDVPKIGSLEGVYKYNGWNDLSRYALSRFVGHNIEAPIVTKDYKLFGIDDTGYVLQFRPETATNEVWADIGPNGHGLGAKFDKDGNLIIADALRGLIKVDKTTKTVSVLASRSNDSVPISFCDDLDIASNGDIYFSDATDTKPMIDVHGHLATGESSRMAALTGQMTGRLLKYSIKTKETTVLMSGVGFANGVALSPDESSVLLCETFRFRVLRHWLKGPKAGTTEVFIDQLPGFPDNIRLDEEDGSFWIGIFSLPPAGLDFIMKNVWVRQIALFLPKFMQPKAVQYGLIVQVDSNGKPILSMHDTKAKFLGSITTAAVYKGKLYLGSLHGGKIVLTDKPMAEDCPYLAKNAETEKVN